MEQKDLIKIALVIAIMIGAAAGLRILQVHEDNFNENLRSAKLLFIESTTPNTTGKEKAEIIQRICDKKFQKGSGLFTDDNGMCYQKLIEMTKI